MTNLRDMETGIEYFVKVSRGDVEGFPIGKITFMGTTTDELKKLNENDCRKFVKCHNTNPESLPDVIWVSDNKDNDTRNALSRLFSSKVEVEK